MKKSAQKGNVKTLVLDTNVLIHDPNCLIKFKDNNVLLSFVVIEELDKLKVGNSTSAFDARAASRTLRTLIDGFISIGGKIDEGIPLNLIAKTTEKLGKLYFQKTSSDVLDSSKSLAINDNLIIKAAKEAMDDVRFKGTTVVLVSKDSNVSIKCATLAIRCEDYRNDRIENQADALHATTHVVDEKLWALYGAKIKAKDRNTVFTLPLGELSVYKNEFVIANNGTSELHGIVTSVDLDEKTFTFKILTDYKKKNKVFGINAKDDRQNFVLNNLLNKDIEIITITGNAGSGKTLLSLAMAYEFVINRQEFDEIIATRAFIPLGEDIGFLPGSEEDKVMPWMGAFTDNIEFLSNLLNPTLKGNLADSFKETESKGNRKKGIAKNVETPVVATSIKTQLSSVIKFKTINFMRGRTFHRKLFIIDEAQNLTPRQIKALVTRVGDGTKIIILGNTNQIDNPYLTPESSGLTYLIHRFRGEENFTHMHLEGVIRSTVAEQAERLL